MTRPTPLYTRIIDYGLDHYLTRLTQIISSVAGLSFKGRQVISILNPASPDYSPTYFNAVAKTIAIFEGNHTQTYYDNMVPPNLTIGIGFNLNQKGAKEVIDAVEGLNYTQLMQGECQPPGGTRDCHGKCQPPASGITGQQINQIFSYSLNGLGSFTGKTQILYARLKAGALLDHVFPAHELIALQSLAFNNAGLVGEKLMAAIKQGDFRGHLEAMVQFIDYSNKDSDPGIAKRRLLEGGIFDGKPSRVSLTNLAFQKIVRKKGLSNLHIIGDTPTAAIPITHPEKNYQGPSTLPPPMPGGDDEGLDEVRYGSINSDNFCIQGGNQIVIGGGGDDEVTVTGPLLTSKVMTIFPSFHYLALGKGNDLYRFSGNFGFPLLFDSDFRGKLIINGDLITGITYATGVTNQYTLEVNGRAYLIDLTRDTKTDTSFASITWNDPNNMVTLANYKGGALGLIPGNFSAWETRDRAQYQGGVSVAILPNRNVIVCEYSFKFLAASINTPQGIAFAQFTVATASSPLQNFDYNAVGQKTIIPLADGTSTIIWSQRTESTDDSGTLHQLVGKIYSAEGDCLGELQVDTPDGKPCLQYSTSGCDIESPIGKAISDDSFIIMYSYVDYSNPPTCIYSLVGQLFDKSGASITSTFTIAKATNGINIGDIVVLPNSQVAVFFMYSDDFDPTSTQILQISLFTKQGQSINDYTIGSTYNIRDDDLTCLVAGVPLTNGFAVIYWAGDSTNGYSLYIKSFDLDKGWSSAYTITTSKSIANSFLTATSLNNDVIQVNWMGIDSLTNGCFVSFTNAGISIFNNFQPNSLTLSATQFPLASTSLLNGDYVIATASVNNPNYLASYQIGITQLVTNSLMPPDNAAANYHQQDKSKHEEIITAINENEVTPQLIQTSNANKLNPAWLAPIKQIASAVLSAASVAYSGVRYYLGWFTANQPNNLPARKKVSVRAASYYEEPAADSSKTYSTPNKQVSSGVMSVGQGLPQPKTFAEDTAEKASTDSPKRQVVESTFIQQQSITDKLTVAQYLGHYSPYTLPHNRVCKFTDEQRASIEAQQQTLAQQEEIFQNKLAKRAYRHGANPDKYHDVDKLIKSTKGMLTQILAKNAATPAMLSNVQQNIERIQRSIPKLTNRQVEKELRRQEIQQARLGRRAQNTGSTSTGTYNTTRALPTFSFWENPVNRPVNTAMLPPTQNLPRLSGR